MSTIICDKLIELCGRERGGAVDSPLDRRVYHPLPSNHDITDDARYHKVYRVAN